MTTTNNSVPLWRKRLQWLTLAVSFLAIVGLMFWPQMLVPAGSAQPFGHGAFSLLFGGLCCGLVVGCGFLQHSPLWQWLLAVVYSWGALVVAVCA